MTGEGNEGNEDEDSDNNEISGSDEESDSSDNDDTGHDDNEINQDEMNSGNDNNNQETHTDDPTNESLNVEVENLNLALVIYQATTEEPLVVTPLNIVHPESEDEFANVMFDDLDDDMSPPIFEFPSEGEQEELDAEFDFMKNISFENEIQYEVNDDMFENVEAETQEGVDNNEEAEDEYEDHGDYVDAVPITIIEEDLVPLIKLCENGDGYSDDDLKFPPGFDPNEVHVEDWVDSDDEIHPEGPVEVDEEPEFRSVPGCVDQPERTFPDWFPPLTEVKSTDLKVKKFFRIPDRELTGRIIIWKYDNDNKVIVVKRTDGLQYFPRSFKRLSSLPKCEVNNIGQKRMINYSGDGMMEWFAGVVMREVFQNRFSYLRETYPRRRIDYFDVEPISNQKRVIVTYKKVKCLKRIPLEKLPINFSRFISYWRYNGGTGEAEIGCYDRADNGEIMWRSLTIVYVYDPLSLINLSIEDLEALSNLDIIYSDECDDWKQALKYQRVVEVCMAHGICAGGNLPE